MYIANKKIATVIITHAENIFLSNFNKNEKYKYNEKDAEGKREIQENKKLQFDRIKSEKATAKTGTNIDPANDAIRVEAGLRETDSNIIYS